MVREELNHKRSKSVSSRQSLKINNDCGKSAIEADRRRNQPARAVGMMVASCINQPSCRRTNKERTAMERRLKYEKNPWKSCLSASWFMLEPGDGFIKTNRPQFFAEGDRPWQTTVTGP
jgi:hypothetical protein